MHEVLKLSVTSHREVFDNLVEVYHIVIDVFKSSSQYQADVCHVDWDFNLGHIHVLLSPLKEDVLVRGVRGAS